MADNIIKGIIVLDASGATKGAAQTSVALGKVEQGFKKLTPASDKATLALTNLSRVAQDAPYGFIGIANNLNPLLESFQRLKAETGSTKTAFQALASGLTGPAGIGLALGVASSLLVAFGGNLFSVSRAAKDAKSSSDELRESIANSFKNAGKEASEVNGLIAILKSETETRERKLSAIKELQKIQPEVFANLKLEKDSVIGLDTAYKNYLNNLRDVIQADILRARLNQLITKQLETQGATATGIIKDFNKFRENILEGAKGGKTNALAEIFKVKDEEKSKVLSRLEKDISDVFAQLQEVTKGVKVPEITIRPDKIKIEKPREAIVLSPLLPKQVDLDPGQSKSRRPDTRFAFFTDDERKQLEDMRSELLLNQQIGQHLADTLASGFVGLFDAIASGKNVLVAFGNIVKNIVVDLIKAIAQAAIFSLLTKAFGVVIPGGGNVFSGLFSRRAVGGPVSPGKGYLVGENGPEYFMPNMGGSIVPNGRMGGYSGGTMQFVLRGQDLYASWTATGRSQGRLG